MAKHLLLALVASCLLLLHGSGLGAQEVSYNNLVTPVLSASQTVIGETLVYPSGKPVLTAVIVTVPPGGETGWHRHPAPLFGYILEGTLEVDYGAHGKRSYRSGEGLLEAMGAPHNGRNLGAVPVRILAVYVGADGLANAEAAKP
jgi:quercetin dioxygenase-like cupin family protein